MKNDRNVQFLLLNRAKDVVHKSSMIFNKANRPTMRPQRLALCVLHYAMVVAEKAVLAEVVVVVAAVVVALVAAVVVLLVVEESHGMILCLMKDRFSHLLKRPDLRTYGPTDGPTDGPMDGQTLLLGHRY